MSVAIELIAAILSGTAAFVLCSLTETPPAPLSPTESGFVGTWTYTDEAGAVCSITFNSDRTCVFPVRHRSIRADGELMDAA